MTMRGGWIESGIGVSGDSGAAILDPVTHGLYGHLWGRNEDRVGHNIPRVTYFTPIDDIFDDIQEKVSGTQRPRLPQPTGAVVPLISAPVCLECRRQDQTRRGDWMPVPETETPGIDITRPEESSCETMTPMRT